MTTSLFGRDVLKLGQRSRKRWIRKALEFWRSNGFPYERLLPEEAQTHFRAVSNAPLQNLTDNRVLGSSSVGLRLANSYHPQIWHARSHGHLRSPHDYFEDDAHLLAMLERSPRFWPHARCWSAQAIRNLVRIYAGGRVANFRPVAARNIIGAFSRDGDVVVDFSAGYGGRLLACMTLDRAYVGIDPARRQVSGLNRMHKELRNQSSSTVEIVKACAEDVLTGMDHSSADLVFSSPPFFNLEIYANEPTQSSTRYKTYDEWVERFLRIILAQSRRVLRRKGLLAINVSSRACRPLAKDTYEIASKLFVHRSTVEIAMPSRPLQRARHGGAYRTEPVFVFQKR